MAFEQIVTNFSTWNGSAGGTPSAPTYLRLDYQDPELLPGLDLSGRVWHFRPGTTGNLKLSPDDGRVFTAVNGVPIAGGDNVGGVTGGGSRYLIPPGDAGDFVYTHEQDYLTNAPPYPADATGTWWFSCWLTLNPVSTYQVLLGGNYNVNPIIHGGSKGKIELSATRLSTTDVRPWQMKLSLGTTDTTGVQSMESTAQVDANGSATMDHLLVQTFVAAVDGVRQWHCRWFYNGLFCGETITDCPTDDPLRLSMRGLEKPVLLAMRQSNAPYTGGPAGTLSVNSPFVGSVDEVMMGHGFPVVDTDGVPIMEHSWTAGVEVFRPTRHPDPQRLGVNSYDFVAYSPWVDTGIAGAAAVNQVYLYGLCNLAGQTVSVSHRAAVFQLSADDAVEPWSEWTQIEPTGGSINGWFTVPQDQGGRGRWVQLRVRVTPSYAPNMVSPTLYYWGVRAAAVVVGSESSNLPARVTISPSSGFDCRVVVKQSGSGDLPARTNIRFQGAAVDLSCRTFVIQSGSSDLPARVYQTTYAGDLPCRVVGDRRWLGELPARAKVFQVLPASSDLPARVNTTRDGLPQLPPDPPKVGTLSGNLPARAFVAAWDLPCRLVIQQAATADLATRAFVLQDTPGSVDPLTSNLPRAAYQRNSRVLFAWAEASWQQYPVTSYYWTLTRTLSTTPTTSWNNRSSRSVEIELNQLGYGTGVWYFSVAARNTAGIFGPVSSYEIRWDRPPAPPATEYMRVRSGAVDYDCIWGQPVVSYNDPKVLMFSVGSDPDVGDVLRHHVQIATRSDFLPDPITGVTSILTSDSFVVSDSVIQFTQSLKPANYFWRVRAFDGRQYSEWGPYVGTFRVNTPPSRPGHLAAAQF